VFIDEPVYVPSASPVDDVPDVPVDPEDPEDPEDPDVPVVSLVLESDDSVPAAPDSSLVDPVSDSALDSDSEALGSVPDPDDPEDEASVPCVAAAAWGATASTEVR
jgi:hypothetical protein